jgi:hypothetical protein
VLENGLPLVLSLWSIATHLFGGFDTFPYLAVTSPTKRCGKTRVGELLEGLCANPEATVQMTPAALFRLVHETKADFDHRRSRKPPRERRMFTSVTCNSERWIPKGKDGAAKRQKE